MDSLISSNIVPMYRNFLTGIWKDAMLLVEEFAEKYGEIHVMTGPVYDYDANGHRDNKAQIKRFVSNGPVPLPTHYYVAAARCETGGDVGKCDHDSVLALAIVIPHRPAILNSKKPIDYLKDNVVRIKDLELLTGLQLFPNITGSNRIILKTFLAVGLWPRFSWMDEEKCIGPEEPVCPWSDSAPLLLISLDGYRDSYLERNLNPVIQKLFKCGSKAPYMRSIYPTLTFPNHYSIVTGLYPESHGIVDNSMYDMNISLPFYLGSPFMNDTRWWLGEPLWNTVTKHKKTAMTFFWPGSDVIIHGKRPNKWVQFNGNYPYAGRVDAILNWINGGTGKRPDFLTLYMELVDKAGHSGGENSLQVNESLVEVDLLMGQLMDGLYRVGLHNCINIIVTADHGMADIAPERNEFLKDYLSNATLSNTYSFLGPAGRISNLYKRSKPPKKGNTHIPPELQTKIADIMNNLTCKTQHMAEYEKPNFAKRHHYAATDRIDSILLYLQEEWQVSRDNPILHFLKGNHGWDPNLESMWALFIAHGPDIKPQHTIKPFENIELYNLMADLLNITAAPNNGTRGSLYHIMRKPPSLAIPSGNPYDSCDFPNDKAEYERRANRTCDCENSTLPDPADVRKWDHRLNLTNDIQHQLANKHMPHGTLLSSYNGSLCLLYHQDFVSAYASALKLPLWTASTVTKSMVSSATGVSSLGPVRPDVRLEQSDQINNCYYLSIKDQNISQASLFTPAFSTNKTTVTDTWIWTNGVPMLSGFLDGIWQYLLKRVKGWVTRYGDLHIVAGPVYDYNYDGVADTTEDIQKNKDEHLNMSLPTHYYMVLLRCPSTNPMKCRDMDYDVQSFILPHLPNVTNCMTEDAYLLEHVARIRDIELLTSTQFLAANNTQTAILTRTYIPHELWLP